MMKRATTPINVKNGFTLIEMMVALLIFSMLSVAGVVLLRGAVTNSEVTAASLGEMAAMQRFVSLIEADLNQAIARTHRDQNGDRTVAFSGQNDDQPNAFLAFTSGGQSNVNDAPRSNLQRIEYRLRDQKIARLHYEMVDGGVISEPADLLSGISRLEVRYRDKSGLWLNDWRTERLTDLPRAVELQFMQNDRVYRHVFLVGTGYL
ncbi:MAG: type II secretion system minor pseudopilin GspJ [Parasphingorhabdus sp.]